jgi:mannose-6-phosphate isomerase-like protein (cupin superfamily)
VNKVISPLKIAESLTELWSPRIVGEVDDAYVKVAKLQGTLTWHAHDKEDEMFLVLKGQLIIEMEEETAILNEGDFFVVPQGVRHNPIANEECLILLFEKKTTLHTGGIEHAKTKSIDEQLP